MYILLCVDPVCIDCPLVGKSSLTFPLTPPNTSHTNRKFQSLLAPFPSSCGGLRAVARHKEVVSNTSTSQHIIAPRAIDI